MAVNAIGALAVSALLRHLPARPSVVELGGQSLAATDEALARIIAEQRGTTRPVDLAALAALVGIPAEAKDGLTARFYRALGFSSYVAIDVYPKHGSLLMDLNRDLRAEYGFGETFDLVTNHGTSEHLFDQRLVFKNMHDLAAVGGVMLHVVPFLNWVNHGFFSTHPVLFADLGVANGYGLLALAVANRWGFAVEATVEDGGAAGGRGGAGGVPPLGLSEATGRLSPGPGVGQTPLGQAILRVMADEQARLGSAQPVPGNVLVVAALQKRVEAPFRTPMQGRYLRRVAEAPLRARYESQAAPPARARQADSPGDFG